MSIEEDVGALASRLKAVTEDCTPYPRYSDSLIEFRNLCTPANISRLLAELEARGKDAGWIRIEDQAPPANGEYLTFAAKSPYPIQVSTWMAAESSWEHEWLKKKRTDFRPKTWITHWRPRPANPIDTALSKGAQEGVV